MTLLLDLSVSTPIGCSLIHSDSPTFKLYMKFSVLHTIPFTNQIFGVLWGNDHPKSRRYIFLFQKAHSRANRRRVCCCASFLCQRKPWDKDGYSSWHARDCTVTQLILIRFGTYAVIVYWHTFTMLLCLFIGLRLLFCDVSKFTSFFKKLLRPLKHLFCAVIKIFISGSMRLIYIHCEGQILT